MSSVAWVLLFVAGLMEPCWVTGMKLSCGFKKPFWTAATLASLFASMYLLAVAIDMGLPVGTAYAVWTGIGAVGALVIGALFFKDKVTRLTVFFIFLMVVGIAGVQMTAGV
jgi:quaternary ammonium compound-resistance protein SugE